MEYTIRVIRIFFFALALCAGILVGYTVPEWEEHWWVAGIVSGCIGALVILVDLLLKGFSLRGMTALTFGLFLGWLAAKLITTSPFFDFPFDMSDGANVILTQNLFLARITLFVVLMYLGAVLALRGKDEFNLVIPYVRFVPHGVDVPLVVVDTSALIDGRVVAICDSRFLGYAMVIPRFVIQELQHIADSSEPSRQVLGRKGMDSLRRLREMKHLDLRINESSVDNRVKVEDKLVFLAQSLKARLLTTDYNLAQIAEFHNIECLNLAGLAKALSPELVPGERVQLKLVKPGKDPEQAIGFLGDGSMVVVTNGRNWLNQTVTVEVTSILPSAGGKMIFASICGM
jgi:uncharacterized protein YacL